MGFSASAHLFYGSLVYDPNVEDLPKLPWKNEEDPELDRDFEEWLTEALGGPAYPADDIPIRDAVITEYFDIREKLLTEFPLRMEYPGHHEYSSEFLVLRGWGAEAIDYGCEVVEPGKLTLSEEDKTRFAEAVKKIGLTIEGPAIHLAASYG